MIIMVGRKRGVIVSGEVVRPDGFGLFFPKGSKALERARRIGRLKLAEEKKIADAKKAAQEKKSLIGLERKIVDFLGKREFELKGRYPPEIFILKSDGKHIIILKKEDQKAERPK